MTRPKGGKRQPRCYQYRKQAEERVAEAIKNLIPIMYINKEVKKETIDDVILKLKYQLGIV
jgi:hypothetical protein